MFPKAARIPEPNSQTILPLADCPTVPLLCLPESRSRRKTLEPPARPYLDCQPRLRWFRDRDWKLDAPQLAQCLAEGRKAAAARQDPIRWCRSPRLLRVAKTTA